jgi:hypothetical protein
MHLSRLNVLKRRLRYKGRGFSRLGTKNTRSGRVFWGGSDQFFYWFAVYS